MAMVDPDRFSGREVAMVYIAGRVGEAKRVERVFSERLVDYVVEREPYQTAGLVEEDSG